MPYSTSGAQLLSLWSMTGDGLTFTGDMLMSGAGAPSWNTVGVKITLTPDTQYSLQDFGRNDSGQLGDGTTSDKSSPVVISGTNWFQISAGGGHTAAIKTDGTLWTWGTNANGQLGDETVVDKSSPIQVGNDYSWKTVSCGEFNTAAIRTDGTLWAWGRNDYGQLGDNTAVQKSSPIQVGAGTDWVSVSCGGYHAAAVKTDGTLWLWGLNDDGQLGNDTSVNASSPVQTIAGGNDWAQVACGSHHTAAVKTDGTLWTWGQNNVGQLGDTTIVNKSSPIQTVAGGTNWKQVACGNIHTAAVKTDGTLWTWGRNGNGQLGDGTGGGSSNDKSSPVQTIAGGTNWNFVSCGLSHTAAIKTDGALWLWGYNGSGQLGDGTTSDKSSPVQTIAGGSNWNQVSCGMYHTAAVSSQDTFNPVVTFPLGDQTSYEQFGLVYSMYNYISSDGTTMTGTLAGWNQTESYTPPSYVNRAYVLRNETLTLLNLPDLGFSSYAVQIAGVSADGSVIAGSVYDPTLGSVTASASLCIWTDGVPSVVSSGDVKLVGQFMSSDGLYVAGETGDGKGFVWNSSTSSLIILDGPIGTGPSTIVASLSADGAKVVGLDSNGEPCIWADFNSAAASLSAALGATSFPTLVTIGYDHGGNSGSSTITAIVERSYDVNFDTARGGIYIIDSAEEYVITHNFVGSTPNVIIHPDSGSPFTVIPDALYVQSPGAQLSSFRFTVPNGTGPFKLTLS